MRSFVTFAFVLLLTPPATAMAQSRSHRPPADRPPAVVPPPIGLPQIGVPLPRLGLPPTSDGFRRIIPFHDGEFPGTEFARVKHLSALSRAPIRRRPFVGTPVIVYVVPQYSIPAAPAPSREQFEIRPTTGSLVLQVEPPTAQAFVDGYYVGMPEDFDGRRGELALDIGRHKVELMAPGYETVSFDVRIAADQPVKYQSDMKPAVVGPPMPAAAPVSSKTFYMVPGCYLGDVPAKDAGLPATCDIARQVIFAK